MARKRDSTFVSVVLFSLFFFRIMVHFCKFNSTIGLARDLFEMFLFSQLLRKRIKLSSPTKKENNFTFHFYNIYMKHREQIKYFLKIQTRRVHQNTSS
jgi:hypothetical protein